MSDIYNYIINEIIDQYLYDENPDRPWIVGFSGGKDSTLVLQLIWEGLKSIPSKYRKREIHVVNNDTLVENPVIETYVNRVLYFIQKSATSQNMPIIVQKTVPSLNDTFFVKLIGLGYPAPNSQFRWCTERLKIIPTSEYIKSIVKEKKEAIVVLGSRISESPNRAKTIKKHNIRGKRLSLHPNLKNVYIYQPIKYLQDYEVWGYLNTHKSPWGIDNSELYKIYYKANADDYECPTIVTTTNTPSCGNSRFGCWTCTVVKEDKSTTALINNGYTWLKPLLKIRNWLVQERNKPENRTDIRRNGQPLKNGGPYTFEYRVKILERILEAQKVIQNKSPDLELISHQELVAIQIYWYRDGFYKVNVSDIYNKIFQKKFTMKEKKEKSKLEETLLKEIVKNTPENFDLIQDLLKIQKTKDLMIRKKGLKSGIEQRIDVFLNEIEKREKNEN